jgi:hypothetical protein
MRLAGILGASHIDRVSGLKRFYRVFRWVVLAVLVMALFLLLKTAPPPTVALDLEAATKVEQKLRRLQTPAGGFTGSLRLSEGEVNGWIQSNLAPKMKSSPDSGAGAARSASNATLDAPTDFTVEKIQSNVRDVKVHLSGDHVSAFVLFNLHGKDLSLSLEGSLSAQDGYLRLAPTQMSLGSMPIPRATLERAVSRLFDSPGNRDQLRLPPNVRDLRVENGELVVTFR